MYMIIQNNVLYCVVVPHITDAIMDWVERVAKIPVDGDHQIPEVCIVEVSWPTKKHKLFSRSSNKHFYQNWFQLAQWFQ
jgi:hypothetical protein